MDTTKAIYRCPHCRAIPPAPHAADCPERTETPASAWHTFVNPPAITIHTRDVGGVLCRWWGDGPVPAGVAMIDAAAAPSPAGALDLQSLKALALATDRARWETEGFEQIVGTGTFYGGLIMHENGHTIIAQQVMSPHAEFIAAANPAVILSLIAQFEAATPPQSLPDLSELTDAAMLDWLERMGNEPEGLLLHDGGDSGRRGLGLQRLGRSLRQAIAQAYSPANSKDQP